MSELHNLEDIKLGKNRIKKIEGLDKNNKIRILELNENAIEKLEGI